MDPKLTLQKMVEECQRIVNIKLDAARIEERDILYVHNVRPFKRKEKNIDVFFFGMFVTLSLSKVIMTSD